MAVSEYEVENLFLQQLQGLGYEYVQLNNYFDVLDNFKEQLEKLNDKYQDLLEFCRIPRSRSEITEHLGMTTTFYAMQRYVQPLLKSGRLEMTIPEAPKSKNQKYVSVKIEEA